MRQNINEFYSVRDDLPVDNYKHFNTRLLIDNRLSIHLFVRVNDRVFLVLKIDILYNTIYIFLIDDFILDWILRASMNKVNNVIMCAINTKTDPLLLQG